MRQPWLLETIILVIIWAILTAFLLYDTPKIVKAAEIIASATEVYE